MDWIVPPAFIPNVEVLTPNVTNLADRAYMM